MKIINHATINIYFPGENVEIDSEILNRLDEIVSLLTEARIERNQIMATLDQVLADVNAETTLIASVSTLIDGLKAQIAAAVPGLTAEQQAEIDNIFAAAEANKAALSAALAANVPTPAPAPTPAPEEPAAA